jgi:hypothetical protein
MSVGTYFFDVKNPECSFHCCLKFDEETENYKLTRRVEANGAIVDRSRASELLIDGKQKLDGLNCCLSIYENEPVELQEPRKNQTQRLQDFPKQLYISKILGSLDYEAGAYDHELDIKFETGLYGGLGVGSQFNEIWNCVSNGRSLLGFRLDVFGAAMIQQQSHGNIRYFWNAASSNREAIYICGFSYSFK